MILQKKEERDLCNDNSLPKPPDGGWGWFVVFGSFMIHIIADGITYSFGIFVEEFTHYFDGSASSVSLIPSILVGVTLGSGPIASSLTNRFGCRVTTIIGAIIAAIGLASSAAVNSIWVLYLTLGLTTGLGFGLIYLPAIVSVSLYFEKKRAFATGIAVCGSGLGTFILSPTTSKLIELTNWQSTLLIFSGLVLLCVAFGALFRPLLPNENVIHLEDSLTNESSIIIPPEIRLNGAMLRPLCVHEGEEMRLALSHPVISSSPIKKLESATFGSHSRIFDKHLLSGSNKASSFGIMQRKDIFYRGSLASIPEFKQKTESHYFKVSKYDVKSNEKDDEKDSETYEKDSLCLNTCHQMLDLSLLRDGIFLLFALSNFLTSIGFNVPYVYNYDRCVMMGMSKEDASTLISIIGIANTLGRIVLGYISDKPWLNTQYLYNLSLSLCGLSICLSNFAESYTTQALYSAIFGITSGAYVGLTSVVLVQLIGLDRLTNGFGLLLLFQGIAAVLGPPLIGSFKDALGSYDVGFYIAGIVILVSGVMLFIIPRMERHKQRKNNNI